MPENRKKELTSGREFGILVKRSTSGAPRRGEAGEKPDDRKKKVLDKFGRA